MAKDLFNRYIWLVDTIYRAGKITLEEINERWLRTEMSGGVEIPLRTFHNHRKAIEEIFDINIGCNRRGGYYYYIENLEDMERSGLRTWLLNTFAVSNLIRESRQLRHRILFENIPSGQRFLTPLIEAMRDGFVVTVTYRSFTHEKASTFDVEPYCLKVFRQRMGTNHYVTLTGNTGVQHDEWRHLFDRMMWGGGVSYGYDTFLGPLEITFNYSNITHKLGTYISFGYEF